MANEEDLIDYDDEPNQAINSNGASQTGKSTRFEGNKVSANKGSYAGIYSTGFRDFLLKAEIVKALTDCGFEHPSQVQQECLPHTILGTDCICQAKSGMGKTAIFVITVLQQIEPVDGEVYALILCHTRELAFQIKNEFVRFSKYLPTVRTGVFYGGTPLANDVQLLQDKSKAPHIVVGTPGRICALVNDKALNLKNVQYFIMDECDRVLESDDMRRDIQEIFRTCPRNKKVMMFTATLNEKMKEICKKFLQNPLEIYIDNDSKLTLHGLSQYYINLEDKQKNTALVDLLDNVTFNQVVVFVKSVERAQQLNKILNDIKFPSIAIHSRLPQNSRIQVYESIKQFDSRILVATDIFARGVDFERINLVINYDMPEDSVQYLHRVGRAGRFGTTGKAVSFVSSESDKTILNEIQSRFEVSITACDVSDIEKLDSQAK